MIYRNSFCPHCFQRVPNGDYVGGIYRDYIGLRYARCQHCNEIYSTGKKLYCEMSEAEKEKMKNKIFTGSISNAFVLLIPLFIIVDIFMAVLSVNPTKEGIITTLIALYTISLIKELISNKKQFEEIKSLTIYNFTAYYINDIQLKDLLEK